MYKNILFSSFPKNFSNVFSIDPGVMQDYVYCAGRFSRFIPDERQAHSVRTDLLEKKSKIPKNFQAYKMLIYRQIPLPAMGQGSVVVFCVLKFIT